MLYLFAAAAVAIGILRLVHGGPFGAPPGSRIVFPSTRGLVEQYEGKPVLNMFLRVWCWVLIRIVNFALLPLSLLRFVPLRRFRKYVVRIEPKS